MFSVEILLIMFEYRYRLLQNISISFAYKRNIRTKPSLKKKVQFKPDMNPFIKPLSPKISFKPVNAIELNENDDIISSYEATTTSNKLNYPTKTNVKDLEKYVPKLEDDLKKGIFFDMTSKEGLSLWGKYLHKLNSNRTKNISPMVEHYKMDTKRNVDMELRKMKETGQLQKYLESQYRRVFIPELKIWVTKNRLERC